MSNNQTSVEIFWNKIALQLSIEQINEFLPEYNKAKEMEIKQAHEYAEFAIRCDRKDMKILNFDGYINLENTEQQTI